MLSPNRSSADLDRRVRRRDGHETSLAGARFLPDTDRAILAGYYRRRRTIRQLAEKYGLTQRQLCRRVNALRRRIADPCFLLCIQFEKRLPRSIAPVAVARFREGLSPAAVARRCNLTSHQVRRTLVLARAVLIVAAAEHYGGDHPRGQALIAAILGTPYRARSATPAALPDSPRRP